MAVSFSIPPNFADAFHEATLRHVYWERGDPEPLLTLQGSRRPISNVCKLAMDFDDRIPEYFRAPVPCGTRRQGADRMIRH